jgi:hypothetical protein
MTEFLRARFVVKLFPDTANLCQFFFRVTRASTDDT